MHTTLAYRLSTVLAVTTLLGIGFPASAHAAAFPALNDPATTETHPGKFVWAELHTADSAAATKFYTGVFGWTAVTVEQKGVTYTVFSNGNHPVAGLRQRSSSAPAHASRWINYIAVTDIASVLSAVTKAGGVVRAPAREFPQIGSQAIITDNEGAPVGLLQSSSGDSRMSSRCPALGIGFHLFVKNQRLPAIFIDRSSTMRWAGHPHGKEERIAALEWRVQSRWRVRPLGWQRCQTRLAGRYPCRESR